MKVGVDGSCWGGDERGVAVATRRLWEALLPRIDLAPTVFARREVGAGLAGARLVAVRPMSGPRRALWQQARLPSLVRDHGIEVLHCPSYTAPLAVRCRTIVTLHDLIAFSHPTLAGWRNALHLRAVVGATVRRAGAVCVPSAVVASAVIQRWGVSPARMFVVPWGVDAELPLMSEAVATSLIAEWFGLTGPFALACGCVEAKKDLAMSAAVAAAAGLPLVIAGPWIGGSAAELPRGDHVHYVGYVSAAQLAALYTAARVLLATSHVEGFGLPPLEAMRHGCPVLARDTPTMREVCGDAAAYASMRGGFAARLCELEASPSWRAELAARGRVRAARFTWHAATTRFLEALDRAAH